MIPVTFYSGPVGIYNWNETPGEADWDLLCCQSQEERDILFRKRQHWAEEGQDDQWLLIQQLHEWVEIEVDYDQIPWTITDPGEEEHIFDKLDEALHRHIAHARAGPPSSVGHHDLTDMYLTRRGLDNEGMPLKTRDGYEYGWAWEHWDPVSICWPNALIAARYFSFAKEGDNFAFLSPDFNLLRRPTRLDEHSEGIEDNEGKIIVRGVMTNKGPNYMKASTPYGDCYINLKFTKYVPEIGESLRMLCRFQDPKMNIPMKCIKVI